MVMQHPTVIAEVVDQCMLGQLGLHGLLVKKPTLLVGNHPLLMAQFDNLRCMGKHPYDQTWTLGQMHKLRVWPWQIAERLIEGIIQLKRVLRKQDKRHISHL